MLCHCRVQKDGEDDDREYDGSLDSFVCCWCQDEFEPAGPNSDSMFSLYQHITTTQVEGHPSKEWCDLLRADPAWQNTSANRRRRRRRLKKAAGDPELVSGNEGEEQEQVGSDEESDSGRQKYRLLC